MATTSGSSASHGVPKRLEAGPSSHCVRQVWTEDCDGVQGEEEGSQARAHLLHVSGSQYELLFCHVLLWFVAIFCDDFCLSY